MSYTKEVRHCMQKRYLYIPINQLHRGGNIMYTEDVPIYAIQAIVLRR